MSDKGFGDPVGRSVLKNPLLSSAVTGLSIEDLTQNAVLLPVAQSQDLITGRDQPTGPQNLTLGNSEINVTNIVTGDVNANITQSNIIPNVTPSLQIIKQDDNHPKINYPPTSTASKAIAKSEDDFDVNEYFARLQGTRYVSAPINSLLKEDNNANLEATEENLEEINLNEPDKSQLEIQQSLTADIAQNFSQLPTVLPQVASAVFSSFSNMLSMKSREQTPDEPKPDFGYQMPSQRQEINVPLMGVDEPVKEVAPPPKEPPIGGPSNYRITTKKKAYAQIPGLTFRDNAQVNAYPPSHSLPSQIPPNPSIIDFQNQPGAPTDDLKPEGPVVDQIKQKEIDMFNPVSVSTYTLEENQTHPPSNNNQPNYFGINIDQQAASNIKPNYYSQKVEIAGGQNPEGLCSQNAPLPAQPNTAIIPPPPMFSNLPRRDSQSGVGKTILPPSVARRISANHPIIKQQSSQAPFNTENIFVPTIDNTQENILVQTSSFSDSQPQKVEQEIKQPPSSLHSTTGISGAQTTNSISFTHTSTQDSSVTTFYMSSLNQTPAASTILHPPPTKPIPPATNVQLGFQAASNLFVPTASVPPAIITSFPADLQPTPTKPIAPPSRLASKPTSNNVQAISKPANLPPMPTDIFTPVFPAEYSQPAVSSNTQITDVTMLSTNFQDEVSVPSTLIYKDNNAISHATANIPPMNIFHSSPSSINNPPSTYHPPSQPPLGSINTNMNISSIETIKAKLPPVPTLFNPNAMQSQNKHITPQKNITDICTPVADSGPPKPVAEPPKITGNLNYRMTKKRPQYYSGPIEGVGSISNNVKPVIPIADSGSPYGAVFTPAHIQDQELVTPNIEQSTVPQTYAPFDINKPQEITSEYSYNTAFDLSRQTTDAYEPPKQEIKGFGIIGSLKSKLGSLDINKIQNSVTTFFDPAYNDSKKETDAQAHNKQYEPQINPSVFVQQHNLGICMDQNPQTYNYQMNYHNQSQNYNAQEYYYENQSQMYPSCTDFSQTNLQHNYETSAATNAAVVDTGIVYHKNLQSNTLGESDTTSNAQISAQSYIYDIEDKQNVFIAESSAEVLLQSIDKGETDLFAQQYLKSPPSIPDLIPKVEGVDLHSNAVTSKGDIKEDTEGTEMSPNIPHVDSELKESVKSIPAEFYNTFASFKTEDKIDKSEIHQTFSVPTYPDNNLEVDLNIPVSRQESESVKLENSFANYSFDTDSNDKDLFSILNNSQEIKKDTVTEHIPTNVSSIPLFDLSSMIANKSQDMEDLNDNMKNVTLYELSKKEVNVFDREASVSFIENDLESKPLLDDSQEEDSISDFNICETCREVNKPEMEEEKEADDLTAQLIENIIAPIQLSNPVEVPFTEIITPVDDGIIFDSEQCAEISHIIEETIETIQGQSAAKLLDSDRTESNPRNYGWCVDNTNTSKIHLDHDYTFQMNKTAIGFYGDNSMFFENIPCNASDELKAEFKNTQDESNAVVLPRSIPTAPPASDDEFKSDEIGGLDVHSIEQDATNDFPLFEEFVIDPLETDDDKIEVKERERNSDDPVPDVDTFTNRVERFKKMEENSEQGDDAFDVHKKIEIVTSTSPAITIASYFDTGNYAAETHYKNSLSSSSPFSQININTPTMSTRVPPGFENDYQRRLSEISPDSCGQIKNEPYIPDTTTQTKITTTNTYSTGQDNLQGTLPTVTETVGLFSKLDLKVQTQEKVQEKLPPFATIFGVNKETTVQSSGPSESKALEETPSHIPPFFGLHPVKMEGGDAASIFDDKPEPETLPDPLSFFSSKDPKEETDNSFNRLASYFSTPTKTDPAKSFFELSQSQNHYRHASNSEDVFKINESHNNNIPNTNLINDLTSTQNFVNNEQVVRTVNYFTVEYDSNININKIKMTEPKYYKERIDENEHNEIQTEVEETCNDDVIKVIKSCSNCCNIKNDDKLYRQVMDNDNSDKGGASMNTSEISDGKNGKRDVTMSFGNSEEANEGVAMLTENRPSLDYTPVRHHWFYRVDFESKSTWRGFSLTDSKALEEAFNSPTLNENTLVATDGGRYDVNIIGRLRIAVYWADKPTSVMRCSWFYKGNTDARYVPYTEAIAEKLEEEYRHGMTAGEWHRRLVLPNNELVVMHGPAVMVHLLQASADGFSSTALFSFGKRVYRNPPKIRVSRDQRAAIDHLIFLVHGAGEYGSKRQQEKHQTAMRPRVVRRGWDESEIEDAEPSNIDHLLLLCHGVGSACDMRFRSVEEVVEDFRATSLQLLQSHYRNSYDNGVVNRVEVLPISWHGSLHSGETGVDRRLAEITLESIPRLRNFTNDTVLDVLFYTSPLYCQTIVNTVCAELNRIYKLFKSRNPSYRGAVSLGGHSLGSVILYDLLCHQNNSGQSPLKRMVGEETGGDSSPPIRYPKLDFSPAALYALGSPIAMFECIRGVDSLGDNFRLPTCTHFFNIFHPYDPIAYRIEPLINRQLKDVKPFLIPHHKGRKRMHLELKDTMARVGADLKQKLMESIKATWTSMWKTPTPPIDTHLEKVVEEEMEKEQAREDCKEETAQEQVTPELLGKLNAGRRVDYVLQEAPFEMINEYLFAMSSHVCYWESEDTMLLMLREIYDSLGVPPDCCVPQQSMTVQRTTNMKEEVETVSAPSTSRGST